MKKINKLVVLFLTLLVLVACDKEEENLLIDGNSAKTDVTLSKEQVLLEKDVEVADALIITMSKPSLGVSVVPAYKISLKIGDNPEKKITFVGDNLTKVFGSVELNKLLLDMGAEAGVETDLNVYGIVELGVKKVFSETKTVKVTPYAMKLDLTTTWGVVGSATPNGWDGPDVPMYKNTANAEEYVAYVTLVDGEIKFRENNDWGNNYGLGSADGVLEHNSPNNIPVTAGTYKITINLSALSYKIESYTWGIVGSATPGQWDGPDVALEYDPTTDMWKAVTKLSAGQIKFRKNNDWGVNFGLGDTEGTLKENSPTNIPVTAGNYIVEVNFNDNTYTLTPIDFIWGVVGSATPGGWNGPDIKMSMDYSKEGVWYVNGADLIDGEIKFRANEDWGNNYGLGSADGVLEYNSPNNIPVGAGKYNVVLDLSDPDAPKYTLTKQ